MNEYINVRSLNHTDLNMYQCGHEDCVSGHSYGPAVRDHFLIHYIHSGKGTFHVGGQTYQLEEGQGFLICPDIITFYQANLQTPWSYSWVGFHGMKAELYLRQAGLSAENPIFQYKSDSSLADCFEQMLLTKKLIKSKETRLLSLLYLFLSLLIEAAKADFTKDETGNRKELYLKKSIDFIERNYSRKISIEEISKHVGLDRSYLGSIFKEVLNISLQHFLINYRLNRACELMKNNLLSIGDISRSVGYEDPLLFSRIFRKFKHVAPREYRKELTDANPAT